MEEPDQPYSPALPASEALESVPVFPLPRLVFFPNTVLPLHLFEPRYKQMIQDCLERPDPLIAVRLMEPDANLVTGSPPQLACVGRVVEHTRLPDGCHNIALHGLCRVSLQEHVEDSHPYRTALATPVSDEGRADAVDIQALVHCASQVASFVRQEHPSFEMDLPSDKPGVLADLVADSLVADPTDRQQILETLNVASRIQLVTSAVGELLGMLTSQGRRGAH